MGTRDLAFLAAAGVIGAGWLFSGTRVDKSAPGWWALGPWLIGGVLMLVVAGVMVELSIRAPKTGGLIFLPLQTGGPLLATVVAAGVWAYYAIQTAGETASMVHNLAAWFDMQWLLIGGWGQTLVRIVLAMVFLAFITAVNLIGPTRFLTVNRRLTLFKILVPVAIVFLLLLLLLLLALSWHPTGTACFPQGTPVTPRESPCFATGKPTPVKDGSVSGMFGAIVGSGVVYSYLGFQGPIDFAGNVKSGGGIREATRLRLAVYGSLGGSIVLYTVLQCVIIYLRFYGHTAGNIDAGDSSVYSVFVQTFLRPGWLAGLFKLILNINSVLSPAGTALVFTYVLTREVAALSRAHLTHRGLQRGQNSVFKPAGLLRKLAGENRLDVYRVILRVDFVVCLVALIVTWGNASVLQSMTSVLALLVYATPSVTLAALWLYESERFPWPFTVLSGLSFVTIGLVFVLASGGALWALGALVVGCALLFGIPALFPGALRYDAQVSWREFDLRKTATRLAAVLGGYFVVLTIAEVIRDHWHRTAGAGWDAAGLSVVAVISVAAFCLLVRLSATYMTENPPLLPEPYPGPGDRDTGESGTSGDGATETGS